MISKTLLDITLFRLKMHELGIKDIRYIESAFGTYQMTWEEYTDYATTIPGDSPQIPIGLVICGDNWWLERIMEVHAYYSQWGFKQNPLFFLQKTTLPHEICLPPPTLD